MKYLHTDDGTKAMKLKFSDVRAALGALTIAALLAVMSVAVSTDRAERRARMTWPTTSTSTVRPVELVPPVSTVRSDRARLDADLARCESAGMAACHVETDSDGSQSVYGATPAPARVVPSPPVPAPPVVTPPVVHRADPVATPAPSPAPHVATPATPRGCTTDCGASPDDTPADVARLRYAECHDAATAGWAAAHADYCARYGQGFWPGS